jgi:putative endonuclease
VTRDPRHVLGHAAERKATHWLEARGLSLLHRNWRGRSGELDLVMRDGPVLVVVEVRARPGRSHEDAMFSIGPAKVRRLGSAVREYVACHRIDEEVPIRIDVVTVAGDPLHPTVRWWRGAIQIPIFY